MREQQGLSLVTRKYLCRFDEILDTMIQDMTQAKATESISHNFIVQMIPHHRAAIEMSQNLLQYTTCLPLQEIASRIIQEQTKSIENMEKALCTCERLQNSQRQLCQYEKCLQQILETMFTRMKDACADNNINANFMREMIPHHRGAIQMSENALKQEICPELIPILQRIIVSQREGVREMERLLQRI